MCRSIKVLRWAPGGATEQEIHEAALQYVRKVSGFRKPSRANQEAFDDAVREVAAATRSLLERIPARPAAHAPPDRTARGAAIALPSPILPGQPLDVKV